MPSTADYSNYGFTWFDWVAEIMKRQVTQDSLQQLSAWATTPQGTSGSPATPADPWADEAFQTNKVDTTLLTNRLDDLQIERPDASPVENLGESMFAGLDTIEDILPSFSGADPTLTIVPAFQFGAASSPAFQGRFVLDYGVQQVFAAVMEWIWYLLGAVGLIFIIRQEWNFWSTLGGSASD